MIGMHQRGRGYGDPGQPAHGRDRQHLTARCRSRVDRPIPTFNDLREELETWRDDSDVERIRDEAQLAAVKLREWTGEKVYARLFDRPDHDPRR